MKPISTPNAPRPAGHYEQAIAHGGLLFVSTQLPIDPSRGPQEVGPVAEQALQVFKNIRAIVEAGGSRLDHIVRVMLYVSSVEHWPAVNAVYESYFGSAKPARGVIPTGKLHLGYDVAADCIAAIVTETSRHDLESQSS
jgi:2-iminobutanoate/2-iminopropanoate deaminase